MSDIIFDNLVFDRLREIGDQNQRIGELESEVARLRLTDAEREAVEWAYSMLTADTHYASVAGTLRGLLARPGGER